jgi:hypothetical protein
VYVIGVCCESLLTMLPRSSSSQGILVKPSENKTGLTLGGSQAEFLVLGVLGKTCGRDS